MTLPASLSASLFRAFFWLNCFLLSGPLVVGQVEWLRTTTHTDLGTHLSGAAQPHDLTHDQAGNLYVTGNYDGEAVFGDTTVLGELEPVFLAKYDMDGSLKWAKGIGGKSDNDGNAVAVNDSGHVYVTGVYTQTNANTILDFGNLTLTGGNEENLFLAKADADGTFLWAIGIIVDDLPGPSQNITPYDMVVDQQGAIYLTGSMEGSLTIEGNAYNTDPVDVENDLLFLAKFQPDGSLAWFRQTHSLGTTSYAIGHQLALASNGDVFLSGEYSLVDFEGDSLPNLSNATEKFVARVNAAGDMQWIHPMSSRLGDQQSYHIGVDQQDQVYTLLTTGSDLYFEDTTIPFPYDYQSVHLLVKLDPNGNRLFLKETAYPNANGSHGLTEENLTTSPDGTTYFTGNAIAFADYLIVGEDSLYLDDVPNSSFVPTPFVAAFDANGNALGVENYIDEFLGSATTYEVETSTMIGHQGKLYLTGFLSGDFRFGADTVATDVFDQLFLVQVDPTFLNATTGLVRQDERLGFQLYPNPTSSVVNLEWGNWQPQHAAELKLMDLSGRTLIKQVIDSPSLQLDVSAFPQGLYVVLIQDDRGWYSRKLQVE